MINQAFEVRVITDSEQLHEITNSSFMLSFSHVVDCEKVFA